MSTGAISVCVLDLNSAVPYYDAYLCSALKRSQVDVRLAAISYYLDRECFSRRGVRNDVPIDRVGRLNLPAPLRRPMKLVEISANLMRLESRFRRNKPDILHVQYLPLLRLGLNAEFGFLERCRTMGIPIVYTVHDILPHDSGEKFRTTYTRLYRVPDLLICHSETVREELISNFGVDARKTQVIAHGPLFYDQKASAGSPFRRELGIPTNAPVVLWQGIIHRYKGLDLLLRSWAMVQKSVAEAKLVIAGTGSAELLDELKSRIQALELRDSVKTCFRYLSTEELIDAYAIADVVVYPYKKVSTSGALMTGLALGKAIVATDLPFFRTALENGTLGQLVPYDEASLANEITRLLINRAERQALEARVADKHFGDNAWDEIAEQTKRCYESVLNPHAKTLP